MDDPRMNTDAIPNHVAIIMDGNGRWAQSRGLDRNRGHREGVESVRAVVREAHNLGINVPTPYAFSMENWNRPKLEVNSLMRLSHDYTDVELPQTSAQQLRLPPTRPPARPSVRRPGGPPRRRAAGAPAGRPAVHSIDFGGF